MTDSSLHARRARRRPRRVARKVGTPVWLFDLDNTLHNASRAIFPAINAGMT
ncbi:HAD family hydrolase, partial [Paraburkholderia sp. BR14261]